MQCSTKHGRTHARRAFTSNVPMLGAMAPAIRNTRSALQHSRTAGNSSVPTTARIPLVSRAGETVAPIANPKRQTCPPRWTRLPFFCPFSRAAPRARARRVPRRDVRRRRPGGRQRVHARGYRLPAPGLRAPALRASRHRGSRIADRALPGRASAAPRSRDVRAPYRDVRARGQRPRSRADPFAHRPHRGAAPCPPRGHASSGPLGSLTYLVHLT